MNSPAGKGPASVDGNDLAAAACTPTNPKQNTSMVKTSFSGMSSSLRERLKKCGRYHPATPPSSRQATPSSYRATPTSNEATPTSNKATPTSTQATLPPNQAMATSSQAAAMFNRQTTPTSNQATPTSSQTTPTSRQLHIQPCEGNPDTNVSVRDSEKLNTPVSSRTTSSVTTLHHSPTSSKTTPPQPRNILVKTPSSSLSCQDSTRTARKHQTKQILCADINKGSMSKLDNSVDDEDKRSMSKLDDSSEDITDKGNISKLDDSMNYTTNKGNISKLDDSMNYTTNKGNSSELENSMDQTCSTQDIPRCASESNGSSVIENNVSCLTDSTNKQTPDSRKKQKLMKDSEILPSANLVDCASLRETKKKLSAELADRKEVLRKLNMVRTYRAKHDLDELQSLINKWRSASQQAVLDLHDLTHDPRPSLTQLVQQLGVDQKLLCYNKEDECFEDD